jgi:2-iminobutanoate/2-iminopropanoate deaminase
MKHKIIQTDAAPAPIGPYSQGREWNGTYFLSGQIAIDPLTGDMIQESIRQETTQIMRNIKAILDAEGLTFDDILKTSIFLINMSDFNQVNEVYGSYFNTIYPARETVAVSALPKGARVEISCIVVKSK